MLAKLRHIQVPINQANVTSNGEHNKAGNSDEHFVDSDTKVIESEADNYKHNSK